MFENIFKPKETAKPVDDTPETNVDKITGRISYLKRKLDGTVRNDIKITKDVATLISEIPSKQQQDKVIDELQKLGKKYFNPAIDDEFKNSMEKILNTKYEVSKSNPKMSEMIDKKAIEYAGGAKVGKDKVVQASFNVQTGKILAEIDESY